MTTSAKYLESKKGESESEAIAFLQAWVNLVDVLERAFHAVVSSHAKAHTRAAMEEASMLMGTVLSLTLTVIPSP